MKPWRTLVVEDQALFRNLLERLLGADRRFSLIAAVEDAETALDIARREAPDFALVDIQLPGMDGVELAGRLRKLHPGCRFLALTTLTDTYTVNRVIEADLHGYIEKDRELDELEAAMLTVARGGRFQTERVREVRDGFRGDPEAYPKILSPREQEIVRAVALGETSAAIAGRLGLSLRTIQNHRFRLMRKLNLKDVAGLTRYALEHGFLPHTEWDDDVIKK